MFVEKQKYYIGGKLSARWLPFLMHYFLSVSSDYFSEKYECDFLVKENLDITEAIQVIYGLNAENVNREIGGLAEAMQTFKIPKGTLIVFDDTNYPVDLPPGVSVIPAYEWLMEENRKPPCPSQAGSGSGSDDC